MLQRYPSTHTQKLLALLLPLAVSGCFGDLDDSPPELANQVVDQLAPGDGALALDPRASDQYGDLRYTEPELAPPSFDELGLEGVPNPNAVASNHLVTPAKATDDNSRPATDGSKLISAAGEPGETEDIECPGTLYLIVDDIHAAIDAIPASQIEDRHRRDLHNKADKIRRELDKGNMCSDKVAKEANKLYKKAVKEVAPGPALDALLALIRSLSAAKAECCGSCDEFALLDMLPAIDAAIDAVDPAHVSDRDRDKLHDHVEHIGKELEKGKPCDHKVQEDIVELLEDVEEKIDDAAGSAKQDVLDRIYDFGVARARCCDGTPATCERDDMEALVAVVQAALDAIDRAHLRDGDRRHMQEDLDDYTLLVQAGSNCSTDAKKKLDRLLRDARDKVDDAAGAAKLALISAIDALMAHREACCTVACGDGVTDAGEECDDGNTIPGDGCDEDCKIEIPDPCGNGVLDPGEECDDGNTDPGDGCDASCKLECGNGVTDPGEECDDGNTTPGDGCNERCEKEVCGNSVLDVGEECDDGNTAPGDGCDEFCMLEDETLCGNGVLDPGEECDDGNRFNGDTCSSTCECKCGDVSSDTTLTCNLTATAGDRQCVRIVRDDVTFDCAGHSIDQSAAEYVSFGIFSNLRDNVTVKNCNVSGFSIGIWLANGRDWLLERNAVKDSHTAILLQQESRDFENIVLRDNEVVTAAPRNVWGVRLYGTWSSRSESDGLVIEGNTITTNSISTAAMRLSYVNGAVIRDNTIIDVHPTSAGQGLQLWRSDRATVSDNYIKDLRTGIYLEGDSHVVSRNTLVDNDTGISFAGADSRVRSNVMLKQATQYGMGFTESYGHGNYHNDVDTSNWIGASDGSGPLQPVYHFDGTYKACPVLPFDGSSGAGRVTLVECSDAQVQNVVMNNGDGIHAVVANNATVVSANISNSPIGVRDYGSSLLRVLTSIFTDVELGIYGFAGKSHVFLLNEISGGLLPFYYQHLSDSVIQLNSIHDAGSPGETYAGGLRLEGEVVRTRVRYNDVIDAGYYGIVYQGYVLHAPATDNEFAGNTVQGSEGADFKMCAQRHSGGSYNNSIHDNVFTVGVAEPMEICLAPECRDNEVVDNIANGVRYTNELCF